MKKSNRIIVISATAVFVCVLAILLTTRLYSGNLSLSLGVGSKNGMDWNTSSTIKKRIIGDGNIVSRTKVLPAFDSVDVHGWFDVTIIPGDKPQATIQIDNNLLPHLNVSVKDHILHINEDPKFSLRHSDAAKVNITSNLLHHINLGGRTRLHATKLDSDKLVLAMGGHNQASLSGHVQYLALLLGGKTILHGKNIQSENIILNIGGKGTVTLAGNVKHFTINSGGESTIQAKELKAQHVSINSAGKSHITLSASNNLTISAFGKSRIEYYGNPKIHKTAFGEVQVVKMKE